MKRSKAEELADGIIAMCHACEVIGEMGSCTKCPMNEKCLSFDGFWQSISAKEIEEFLDFADDIENYEEELEEADYEAEHADLYRKMAIEEEMIDRDWGY